MSIIGSNILAGAAGSGVSAYEIEQSLRFDGAAELYWTPSSAGNRDTWTWSAWIKLSKPHSGTDQTIFSAYTSGNTNSTQMSLSMPGSTSAHGSDTLSCGLYSQAPKYTPARWRDYSAWYHVVIVRERGAATTTDGLRFYVNNKREDADFYNSLLTNVTAINNNITHRIGEFNNYNRHFHGYMAEVHFLDGTAVTNAEDFGEYDDNGVWRPIEYTGSYGTNGFYLKFDPTATNGIGHDHSGNGNNWTASGFTTSGIGTDVMSDTPTTNYCTWNPLTIRNGSGTMSLTEGNLKFGSTASSTYGSILATIAPTSGKYYCELTFEGTKSSNINRELFGIVPIANWQTNTRVDVHQITGSLVYESDGTNGYAHQGTNGIANTQSYGVAWDENSNIGIAIDFDTPSLTFYVDGSSQGTFPYSMTAGEAYAIFAIDWSNYVEISAFILNAGQRDFAYTPPTGFKALNTSNLPAPTVKEGVKHFSANTWTGNGTTNNALTGFGHQPDFVWGKARSAAYAHALFDSIRGGDKRVYNNGSTPPAQDTNSEYIKSFDSDGITLGSDDNLNGNTVTFVGWSWKGGGTVSADNNTDGDITATVSANPTAGFSVIKYTSSGTSGDSIGHGLGAAPAFFIVKNIDATDHYACYHQGIGNGKALLLNSGNSAYTDVAFWNNTSPTSTVITLGNETSTNNSDSDDYICWAWAEIEGFSKFGTYQGSTSLPFVYCGFRPAFIILKPYDFGSGWYLYDSARGEYNTVSMRVLAESAAAETSAAGNDIDILSNGFKLRGVSNSGSNYNGKNYIFCAWAEHPFGGDGVSPATAR